MPAKRSLGRVIAEGDYRAQLEALRDRLVVEVERSEGAAVASLARQLGDVLKQLDGMAEPEVSAVDDIARQRSKRRGTGASDSAGRSVGRGAGGGGARRDRGTGS